MSSEQAGGAPGSSPVSDRMRALLSRAAEEQLLEQRQVSAVLGELRALLQDVDERLVTGEQVERVGAEVRALSARVEARLDAAEARSAELAQRIPDATAMVGQAAQDLVEAVAARVEERFEALLRETTADVVASLGGLVDASERRTATHVDDAVLALAEVVLRRGRLGPVAPADASDTDAGAVDASAADVSDVPPVTTPDDAPPAEPEPQPETAAGDTTEPAAPSSDTPEPDPAAPQPEHQERAVALDVAAEGAERAATGPSPVDGFVLVPADVEDDDAEPAPPPQQERRSADRRTAERSDGSGRRRRPWWRPV